MECLTSNHLKRNISADILFVLFILVYKKGVTRIILHEKIESTENRTNA